MKETVDFVSDFCRNSTKKEMKTVTKTMRSVKPKAFICLILSFILMLSVLIFAESTEESESAADTTTETASISDVHTESVTESIVDEDDDGEATGIAAWFGKLISDFKSQYKINFVDYPGWKYILQGIKNTLIITFFAALIGITIGIIIASIRTTYDKNAEVMKIKGGVKYHLMKLVNGICKIYLTVIRGTPVVVQLLIMYFVILASSRNEILVAIISFGINSGAYVAEILRGGIMSIDNGQFEAGRSLGFNYTQTMIYIIIPQVIKNVLPTLLNETIALLKETSVAGYVGIMDLTKAGEIIRGRTFSSLFPLLAVAIIYLAVVMIMTKLVSIVERRLRKSER